MNFSHVILIDDSDVDRYLIKRHLKKLELSTSFVEAEDGEKALEKLVDFASTHGQENDQPQSLLMVDINMPIMNGFEFLEAFSKLRDEHPSLENIAVFMVSSSEDSIDIERAETFNFVRGFITKLPKTAEELRDRLAEAC